MRTRVRARSLPAAALLCAGLLGTAAFAAAKEITLPVETIFLAPSKVPGYVPASSLCVTCHSADYVKYQPGTLTRANWTAEVTKMKKTYGAPIPDEAINPIADYLVKTYGAERAK
jgi:hypothetical protein